MIEPYIPSRFARKFGHNQLYIENPNASLHFSENRFEGAWAWYYNSARGTWAIFSLPQKALNSYTSLSFCMRYIITYTVPGFGINTSCIKAIKSMYNARRGPNASRIREMNEYLEAEKQAGRYKGLRVRTWCKNH